MLLLVDLFAIETEPRVHQPHEVLIPPIDAAFPNLVLYGVPTPSRNDSSKVMANSGSSNTEC